MFNGYFSSNNRNNNEVLLLLDFCIDRFARTLWYHWMIRRATNDKLWHTTNGMAFQIGKTFHTRRGYKPKVWAVATSRNDIWLKELWLHNLRVFWMIVWRRKKNDSKLSFLNKCSFLPRIMFKPSMQTTRFPKLHQEHVSKLMHTYTNKQRSNKRRRKKKRKYYFIVST